VLEVQANALHLSEVPMNKDECACGDSSDPLVTHRTDGPCYMTEPKNTPDRLRGGLSHFIRKFRAEVTLGDTFYTVLGALIGAGVGVLFAALWVR
jgi:hypothetical protein